MNNLKYFLIIIILSGCSLNKNSKFWTISEKIDKESILDNKIVKEEFFKEESVLDKEFNQNLKIKIDGKTNSNKQIINFSNNNERANFDGNLQNISRYKFSKIKNFYQYEPEVSFHGENVIFFNNEGTILKFNEKSNLNWQKNYYSKSEKKLRPILQFANNNKHLVVADNIAKYYLLDIETGQLMWSKNNVAPFNSQIKIYKDKIFVIDFSNTLRCFSLKNGDELWNVKTESSLIRSQKKLSMVIVKNTILFNNSIGDISAVDLNNGELLWQLPTQSSLIYESTFSLETSDIITDNKSLYFSNNQNQFFSLDINTGSFNWETKINSSLRPTLIGNMLFTVSQEGYLFLIDKNNGNIIKTTDVFENFKKKKRNSIKPTGFILGKSKIYISTDNGRLLVVDIETGKTISTLKIDNEKILRPKILNEKLFVVKNNSIIKLN
ncbi:PQQ-binding-like beta-propeller repeat protein [Candidatus Pelagibacter sp.]|nr:PQQ-binding-like beta-propeller repeat protein [Candidatus Pelagibacter sp.]